MNGPDLPALPDCWDPGQPAASMERLTALLPHAERGGDPDYLLSLGALRVRGLLLRHDMAEAATLLDEVEAALTPQTPMARLAILLERARFDCLRNEASGTLLAEQTWKQALRLRRDDLAIDAACLLANGPNEAARQRWLPQAVTLAERSASEGARRWLPIVWNQLAWLRFEQQKFDEALGLQQQCAAWHQQHNAPTKAALAQWNQGRILREQGKIEEAWSAQLTLKTEMEEAGLPADGYLFEELGELALLRQDPEIGAEEFFARAWFLLSRDEWLKTQAPERIERLKRLAKL